MDRHSYLVRAHEFCKRGKALPQTKLTDLDVVGIRSAARQREALRKHIKDNLSNEALAKAHGVHLCTIEKIISNLTRTTVT